LRKTFPNIRTIILGCTFRLFLGGVFLLYKASHEIFVEVEAREEDGPPDEINTDGVAAKEAGNKLFWGTIGQIGVEVHALVLPDDASNASIAAALRTALDGDPDKVVLWVHAPSIDEASTTALAAYLLPIAATQPLRVLGCWLGEATVQKARALWRQAGIPDFATPEAAIRAWNLWRTHRQHQQQLLQTPPRHPSQCCDVQRLRAYLHRQDWAASATPITLEDTHAREVLAAAGWSIHANLSTSHPARLVMQVRDDPAFGPVLALGLGDASQERYALALPPLNIALAKTALSVLNLEQDVLEKCALAWVSLSQLLLEMPTCHDAVFECAADAQGWTVLRARMHLLPNLCASEPSCMTRFAIQPYPDALVQVQDWHGQALTIRPIRPEDEAQHLAFLRQLSPEDIRMRIFHSRRTIDHSELAHLTQIDYAREMALIATVVENGIEATLGTVRAMIDPDNDTAEFGVIVRSDLKNGGIGRRLMLALIAHLRERGTRRVVGAVLRANLAMRQFAQSLGFTEHPYGDAAQNEAPDEHICLVELLLQPNS
jgi:RimJ/RimL family protein N-acetyltransferase